MVVGWAISLDDAFESLLSSVACVKLDGMIIEVGSSLCEGGRKGLDFPPTALPPLVILFILLRKETILIALVSLRTFLTGTALTMLWNLTWWVLGIPPQFLQQQLLRRTCMRCSVLSRILYVRPPMFNVSSEDLSLVVLLCAITF